MSTLINRRGVAIPIAHYPDGVPMIKPLHTAVDRTEHLTLRSSNMADFVATMFYVDALRDRGCKRISLSLPYVPGARQDRILGKWGSDFLFTAKSVAGMLNARRDLTDVLGHCDDAAVNRTVRHERIGIMTIADIARKMAEHEQEHDVSIAKLVRQAPASGRVIIPLVRRS